MATRIPHGVVTTPPLRRLRWPKMASIWLQDGFKMPDGTKTAEACPKMVATLPQDGLIWPQDRPKGYEKAPPEHRKWCSCRGAVQFLLNWSVSSCPLHLGSDLAPSWPQEAPRWPQDGPRWPQDGHKMAPRWPQDNPIMAPRWPKMVHDGRIFAKMVSRWPKMPQNGSRKTKK